MKSIDRKLLFAATFVASLFAIAPAGAHVPPSPKPAPTDWHHPRVQLALLLDTSNSMDGLIDQARSRLWQIVNELARARCDGARPRLEVALFEYGNNGLPRDGGFIREVCMFTGDLDVISNELFALRTNGGEEFCGAVIDRALCNLSWSRRPGDLRMIFIAGNEPFTQGSIDFRPVVRRAAEMGISVNTIFCGPQHEGVITHWKTGADLSSGTYASINQDCRLPVIDAPQDRELARLNDQLNRTYLAYGAEGRSRAELQVRQDTLAAAAAPSSYAGRVAAKASPLYSNSSWDLVDAVNEGKAEVSEIPSDELPEELRALSVEERRKRIEAASEERVRIQNRIRDLSKEREAHVAGEMAKYAASESTALDAAILQSVRDQAAKLNYTFE